MGWFKKEAKAFGKEFLRQGSILVFGSAPKPRYRQKANSLTGAERQYRQAQRWARKRGFKK